MLLLPATLLVSSFSTFEFASPDFFFPDLCVSHSRSVGIEENSEKTKPPTKKIKKKITPKEEMDAERCWPLLAGVLVGCVGFRLRGC